MSVLSAEESAGLDTVLAAPLVLPVVNLLPPEIGEQARLRRLQLVLAAGLVATAGVVGLLYVDAASSVSEATAQVEQVTARGGQLQAEARHYADVDVVYEQADAAQSLLREAMGQEVRFSQFLDRLSKSVPEHVWLKNISFTQSTAAAASPTAAPVPSAAAGIGTVTFTGVGFSHDDVAAWLESLATQEGFSDPYITDSTAGRIGDRKTVSFTSQVTLTSDALSGRYAEEGS